MRSTNCLICPSDDEWTSEQALFEELRIGQYHFYPRGECLLPHTRLHGESVCRTLSLTPKIAIVARLTFDKESGIGSILHQQFEAWTYTLSFRVFLGKN
jgi:hypothetical protein